MLHNRRPSQPTPKSPEHRLNDQIRVPQVRLVGDNLEQLSEILGYTLESGVYDTRRLRDIAEKVEMDLVEIVPNATPPVCRIIDYGKFLYERKKKDKELKSKQEKSVIKEIRFGPNTDDHDFDFKLKHALNFLDEGAKIRAYVQFKGRAIVYKDRGEQILQRFIDGLSEKGAPDAPPTLENKRMIVYISAKKKK